ncbi:peptide ABC transporter substrate-binding protein [Oscillospiraceae bacterium]|nr:peptide ABC transporter substrate-binding protein [Oscillospiraceae bacterium]BDF76760.1 peptide ABC transporter substrate-binding protein [Oscillospiraceae bacterium]
MKRRLAALLPALALMGAVLTGCGGQTAATPTPAPQTGAPVPESAVPVGGGQSTGETMVEGGSFTMAIEESITSLAWYNNNSTDQGEQVFQSLYDPLWKTNADSSQRFYLAESCDVSEDGTVYTVHLRQDAYWHDGEQITADDLMFTMDWFADPDCGNRMAASRFKVDGEFCAYEKLDGFTVQYTISRPSNLFLEKLGYTRIMPEHIFQGVPAADILTCDQNSLGVGSGAFKLQEFVVGEKLVLARNDAYYGDVAHIDTLEIRCIANTGTQEVAFRNGELSVYTISNAETLASFQADAAYNLNTYRDGRITFMEINPNSEAMSTLEARQAVIYALNLDEIILGTYGSAELCRTANSIQSTESMFHNPAIRNYTQDVEQAKALAQSSGLTGKTLHIIFNSSRVGQKEMAIMIQSQLQAAGITAQVDSMDTSGYFSAYFYATDSYDMALMGNGMKGDPGNYAGLFNNTKSGANMYTTDEVNALWDEIDKELDPAKRQELINQVDAALMDCWSCVPISDHNCVFASQPNIRGFEETEQMTDLTKLYFVE